ncbi:MAG TPA: hypothetical protein VK688_11710 [Gemmatimonadales bacterium]|nr:hypothetical protein [Gemmatimonadales bacterium]
MTSTPQPDAPAATRSPVTSGQVTFSRTDPTDVGQRQIYVRVDEAPTRTLRFGESHTEVVTPGSHRLHANNTLFWKRVAFTIEPGEEIEFALINRAGAVAATLLALVGVAPLRLVIEKRRSANRPRAANT